MPVNSSYQKGASAFWEIQVHRVLDYQVYFFNRFSPPKYESTPRVQK